MSMRLRVLLPTEVLLDAEADRIVAEAENGSFCLLPRHVDFVAALVPGILAYTPPAGEARYLAVDEGILVKYGRDVLVSASNALASESLGELTEAIDRDFRSLTEEQRAARSALARLEAGTIRRFLELELDRHA